MNIFIDSEISDDDCRKELCQPAIFLHAPCVDSVKLGQLARAMAEEAFSPLNPRQVQDPMAADRTTEILSVLKPKFIHDPRLRNAFRGPELERRT